MGEFSNKIVLVTGGATGIGKAASLAFARRGASVIIAGRRQAEGEAAVAEITKLGVAARFIRTDVSDPKQLADLHETIVGDFGRLDVAFNNAGYQEPRAPIAEQDAGLYTRVFDTNVRAVYLSLQHQIRIMQKQGGGAIVVNTSVSGFRNPNPGLALYSDRRPRSFR
jgi:NAD(P)-dependent dehydrogenase (short-subunit alcohol dehydrogenase family)